MKIIIALSVIVAAAIIEHGVSAQSPRDVPRVADSGSAAISGLVVADDESHAPLRRVVLTLSRTGLNDTRVTATDDHGQYLFSNLPAATYLMSASKGGYVDASYGATRLGLSGSPIPLTAGQQFSAKPLPLLHGGAISGRLTSVKGHPVSDVTVQADQFEIVNGARRPRVFPGSYGRAITDSDGTYRIFGLAPGNYVVSTSAQSFDRAEKRELTAAEVQWARQQLGAGASSTSAAVPGAPQAARPFTAAPSYFPGTADPTAATVISLGRSEEREGVDYSLVNVATARVSGNVVGVDGQPVNTSIMRVSRGTDPANTMLGFARSGVDGKFSMPGVPPGDYTFLATRGGDANAPTAAQWGAVDISVSGDDIADVAIRLQPSMTMSGRITFEGTSPRIDLNRVQLQLSTRVATLPMSIPTTVNSDGTFKFAGLIPGEYQLTTVASSPLPAPWRLKSAAWDGKNIVDVPFEMHPGQDVSEVVVTLSDRRTELSGRLLDATTGQPAPQFFVLAFPTDRTYWTRGSRWIQSVRASIDGSFKIEDLPAGEYYLCALTEIDLTQLFDPTYLEPLVAASKTITLAEGQRQLLDLRIGSAVPAQPAVR